jgi:hypothetical protein
VKYPKTQRGNPRRLTVQQHVFPLRSLRRFCNSLGLLEVQRKGTPEIIRLKPDHPLFCARRAWDQRAETGFMKRIEDDFQPLADRVAHGQGSLGAEERKIVTRFYALWRLRAQHRSSPLQDRDGAGVAPELLTIDQQENLEKNGYLFVGPDGKFAGRMLAGLYIQRGVDFWEYQLRGESWGVARARHGEFVVPDDFGSTPIVPVTPKVCLIAGAGDMGLVTHGVRDMNLTAQSSHGEYMLARAFAACPM